MVQDDGPVGLDALLSYSTTSGSYRTRGWRWSQRSPSGLGSRRSPAGRCGYARVVRAGATGPNLLRADSGFWNTKVFELLEKAGWQYSIGVRMIKSVRAAVEAIDGTPGSGSTTPKKARRRSPKPNTTAAG